MVGAVNKTIAVIMSVYKNDRHEFVRMAVESILSQTYGNFDFYIQYDGPVRQDVDNYLMSLTDNRVIIFKNDDNRGLASSLNDLLKRVLPAGYDYIARMDADDISLPQRFEKQIEYFEKYPQVSCLGTGALEITSTGDEYFRKMMPETHKDCYNLFKIRDCVIHPTVMFRRVFFEKAGWYPIDTFFAEDTMLWAYGFKNGCTFANVPEVLFKFRLDDNFFSRRRGWKYAKGIYQDRHKVNRILGFGFYGEMMALAYCFAKLMPTGVLNILYKVVRK